MVYPYIWWFIPYFTIISMLSPTIFTQLWAARRAGATLAGRAGRGASGFFGVLRGRDRWTMGKKPWGNHGETMGKPWENQGLKISCDFHGIERPDFLVDTIYISVQWDENDESRKTTSSLNWGSNWMASGSHRSFAIGLSTNIYDLYLRYLGWILKCLG